MHEFTVLLAFLIGFLIPALSGIWVGTFARRPIGGFFLGWVATVITAAIAALVLIATIAAPFATIVAVESPVVALGSGLIAGGISAFVIYRRLAALKSSPIGEQAKDLLVTDLKK